MEADLLIHVMDASSPQAKNQKTAVEKVLAELKAHEKPVILALNKADLLNEEERRRVQDQWPEGILISAKDGQGLHSLLLMLEKKEIEQKEKIL